MKKAMVPRSERKNTMISLRLPEDVIDDLKKLAVMKGVGGYQPLIKLYIGKGMREDLRIMRQQEVARKAEEILQKHNVDRQIIEEIKSAVG